MRRSICYCNPTYALAGDINTWNFIYTTATDLPKGTILRFDMMTDDRDIDWQLPTTQVKNGSNVIFAKMENGKQLTAKQIEIPDAFSPQFEFILPKKLEATQTLTITVGSSKSQQNLLKKNGNQAQTYAKRRRSFYLFIDPTGKKRFEEPEIFSLDVKGNVLHHINVITPSYVSRNKRFDVIVRFEDEFDNLTSNANEETLVELSYEQLRENLSWKLFVPETGFISLPNLYFNEAGIYTIQLKNTVTKEVFRSPPIKCFNENSPHIFWGLLHGESVRVDSTENIENCLRHFRDEKSFNFYATSAFEAQEETPNEIWKLIGQNVAEFDETDRFTTYLGMQWKGQPKVEGVRQFLFSKDSKPLLRKKDQKYNSLKKIYKAFSSKDLLSIPSFTMGQGTEFDFHEFNPEFERVVEIYNSWGSSECLKEEGNPKPIKGPKKGGVQESKEGSILKALQENKRFGFVAGGLDDRGIYQDFYESDQEQYSPGLTAIIASEHTRGALWDALYRRSCYATTGERIILGFHLAGLPIGTETSTQEKHGLNINRHLSGFVAGTTKLKSIEIIRGGEILTTFHPNDYHYHFSYDDMESLADIVIQAKDKSLPFIFYYLRVVQEDGHMAWSSPIWVDYVPGKTATVKKGKGQKSAKKTVATNEEDNKGNPTTIDDIKNPDD